MPRNPTKSLTVLDVKNAQPRENEYKLTDGGGLYLLVKPTGAKYWRLKYRIFGKEKKLSIGVYPNVSLAQTLAERESAKKQVSEGKDPTAENGLPNRLNRAIMPILSIPLRWSGSPTNPNSLMFGVRLMLMT